MMKNSLLYSVLVMCLVGLYSVQSVSSDTNKIAELKEIIEVTKTEKIDVQSWSVYSKFDRKMVRDSQSVDQMIQDLEKENREFDWNEENVRNGEYRKRVGTKQTSIGTERVVITSHESAGTQMMSMTHQMSGKGWKDEMYDIISENIQGEEIYVTVQGSMKKHMELDQMANKLVSEFSGEVKEGIAEETFISLSAYTDQWQNGISINETEKVNLQIGVRDLGNEGSVNVTIGTPIIIAEY
ncbi:hypothetical protein JCM9140_3564 [Halalkalibacter wakoensis JCM 9140]|uniref:TATA-box binding n=1 Tax=Halalkalibacter wakoensis JCM 9140 TaxID=1236970 RepID=W4Q619_9BACI|nr:YwmB family TATA-box binding protein [Halalkalibacter wakoensis]GAE27417.1 hypothetical protein JCM9140_3564 [Halalkalibacter wakoensis JCM 9140]